MKLTEQYTFEDYYGLVVANISKRVLTKEVLETTKEELFELIFDLYYQEINPAKSVVILESFYSKFKKFLN